MIGKNWIPACAGMTKRLATWVRTGSGDAIGMGLILAAFMILAWIVMALA